MASRTYDQIYEEFLRQCNTESNFMLLAERTACVKEQVFNEYFKSKELRKDELNTHASNVVKNAVENRDDVNVLYDACNYVWIHGLYPNIVATCASKETYERNKNTTEIKTTAEAEYYPEKGTEVTRPFDRRLDRYEKDLRNKVMNAGLRIPFASSIDFTETTTSGYLITEDDIKRVTDSKVKADAEQLRKAELGKMQGNEFYKGVPALQNTYALVRLYGSDGGKYLVNQKEKRKWYEVDVAGDQAYNYSSTPTTTALIDWGNGDPYGRTPYHFTDFVFAKYWNKISNNRLITLRRFAAPILDNLKFPGMKGGTDYGTSLSDTGKQTLGSSKDEAIPFPPMATAITFFGGESGNTLNNILKFTTGVLWDDVQAGIWEVTTESVPDVTSGAGRLYGGLAKFAEMLNVAGGNFDRELIMNAGQLPPDPYNNGPYENRIMGPVNRIDSVKKRKAGLDFKWEGLNLVFEYVARPVGGINPKAVLLDIMSNFLVMGSASAVFFGGAHRFMANPEKYPFIGGDEGIEKWYKGNPIGWGLTAIRQFSGEKGQKGSGSGAASALLESARLFMDQLLSGEKGSLFGAVSSLFTGAAGNLINNEIAKKTAGQVPYLQGMRAILTGEPVGEWHVTIGNPLNPIAMIGNLICEGIDVEFNEELGPDDFPTEMKITVKLKHAMARDRDAIESVFNRGMGRIYTLSDDFLGSADYQTSVDQATQDKLQTGYAPNRRMGIMYHEGMDSGYMPKGEAEGTTSQIGGSVSIWNRRAFSAGINESDAAALSNNEMFKSAYRAANWIAQKSLL